LPANSPALRKIELFLFTIGVNLFVLQSNAVRRTSFPFPTVAEPQCTL
jgi:hypothetical protein